MKVRSNPKHGAHAVQYPNLRGVYIGAVVDVEASKDKYAQDGKTVIEPGRRVFKFLDEDVNLLAEGETGADFTRKHPHEYAYLCKKVQEGELLAADAEMAKMAGVKFVSLEKVEEKKSGDKLADIFAPLKDEHGNDVNVPPAGDHEEHQPLATEHIKELAAEMAKNAPASEVEHIDLTQSEPPHAG